MSVNLCPETLTKPVEAGGGAAVVDPVPKVVVATVVVVGGVVVVGDAGALVPGIH